MKKIKFKINSVDILIACFMVVLVSILANTFFSNEMLIETQKKEKITVTVTAKDIDIEYEGLVKENDIAFLSDNENISGKVVSASYQSTQYSVTDSATGRASTLTSTDKVDAKISIEFEAVRSGKYIIIEGKKYTVGDNIDIAIPGFTSNCVITSLKNSR